MAHPDRHNAELSQAVTEQSQNSVRLRAPELLPGAIIADGRYRIVSTIGYGAMGCVYEVEQVFMKKRFAMKLLLSSIESASVIRRFQKEAQMASRLDHPNLVHAVDFGMINSIQPYLVMELVHGITLAHYLKSNGPLPVDLAIEIFIPICLALDYAHREGVVHRDLKPGNIILENNPAAFGSPFLPKIVDFGIAKLDLNEETALTAVGEVLGTPLYMSPEQCAGETVGTTSDVYSLGCVIYECLTGTPPFSGANSLVTMMKHRSDAPPSMTEASMGTKFPRSLERIVEKMLAKDPAKRYATCMEVAQDFEYVKRGDHDKVSLSQDASSEQISALGLKGSPRLQIALGVIFSVLVISLLVVSGGKIGDESAATGTSSVVKTVPYNTFETYKFADVAEHSFSQSALDEHLYTFPTTDSMGQLYWWTKGASEPGSHPAVGTFKTPGGARPILDIGWDVLAHKATYLNGFNYNELSGALINIRADWATWGGQDSNLDEALRLLENQSQTLKILVLETHFSKDFLFSKTQLECLNKLSRVEWLCVRRTILEDSIVNFSFFPRLKVLTLRELGSCSHILQRLVNSKNINRLSLFDCNLAATDLDSIAHMRNLHMLEIRRFKKITGADVTPRLLIEGIATNRRLEQLCLDLWNIDVTPEGLSQFAKLKKLKVLTVFYSPVKSPSPPVVAALQNALPNCKIVCKPEEKDAEVEPWCNPLRTNPGEALADW